MFNIAHLLGNMKIDSRNISYPDQGVINQDRKFEITSDVGELDPPDRNVVSRLLTFPPPRDFDFPFCLPFFLCFDETPCRFFSSSDMPANSSDASPSLFFRLCVRMVARRRASACASTTKGCTSPRVPTASSTTRSGRCCS